jgi:hypothetical protein
MSPESVSEVEPQPSGMSEIGRLSGVFFEPTKAFEDIARRPGWLIPMLIVIVCAVSVSVAFTQHVGWERFFRQQIEINPRTAQLSTEQKEQAIATQVRFAPIGIVAIVIGIPIYYLIASGVLLGIVAGIMSAPVKYKQVFAVMSYAGLTGVVSSILTLAVMFLKNPDQFNLQNALVFNPGAFMDQQSSSKFLYSLATSLDLFSLWTMLLIAVGLKAAAGKKLSFGGALFSVLLPWGVYVLGKSALAGVFS